MSADRLFDGGYTSDVGCYVTKNDCKEWRQNMEKELSRIRSDLDNIRLCINEKLNRIINVSFTILGGLVISLAVLALNLVVRFLSTGQ